MKQNIMKANCWLHHPLHLLPMLTLATYLLAYLYLVFYHQKLLLFNHIIHEGGEYSLIQTILYASHFLGHIPTHTVLSFLFVGAFICMSGHSKSQEIHLLIQIMVCFLGTSVFLSLWIFGYEDTSQFIFQTKQNVSLFEDGGAWSLHLPSTILLFVGIPAYIYCLKRCLNQQVCLTFNGSVLLKIALVMTVIFTLLFCNNPLQAILRAWSSPRYLAHSIREIVTFFLTYFPIAFYLLAIDEQPHRSLETPRTPLIIILLICIFVVGIFYQAVVPLIVGISILSQKPLFASNGTLGIPYLFASHFFEHVMDTLYFWILTLMIYRKSKNNVFTSQ